MFKETSLGLQDDQARLSRTKTVDFKTVIQAGKSGK